jgi:uncharacterized protein
VSGDPLQFAARLGYSDVVLLLIKNGHPDRQRDAGGASLLHLAAQNGHANVTAVLLSRGASVADVDDTGYTPVHAAAKLGFRDVLQQLVRRGGDVKGENRARSDDGGVAAKREVNPPLLLAAAEGHTDCVSLLLQKGADVAQEGLNEMTALHAASSAGQLAVVELLLEAHHAHKTLWLGDADGNTPLHLAVANGHTAVASALIQRGADASAKDNNGATPIDLAAGNAEMMAIVAPHGEL